MCGVAFGVVVVGVRRCWGCTPQVPRRPRPRDGWTDGQMDGWMGGWIDGWMDGWTDERIVALIYHGCALIFFVWRQVERVSARKQARRRYEIFLINLIIN